MNDVKVYEDRSWADDDSGVVDAISKRHGRARTVLTSVGIMAAAGVIGFGGAMLVNNAVLTSGPGTTSTTSTTQSGTLSDTLGGTLGGGGSG